MTYALIEIPDKSRAVSIGSSRRWTLFLYDVQLIPLLRHTMRKTSSILIAEFSRVFCSFPFIPGRPGDLPAVAWCEGR